MDLDDLDHPFYAVWNIDKSALDDLRRRFARQLATPDRCRSLK
jgi:hypothetical protein